MDVGGKTPATEAADATEVWQEGLLLPIVKLYDGGTPNQAIFDVLAANVRIPKETLGDVRSQIAACRTGERRWVELCERYGADDLQGYVEDLWRYAETDGAQRDRRHAPRGRSSRGLHGPRSLQ